MKVCWCGCTEFESFSEAYMRCKKCRTLISKHGESIQEEVEKSASSDESLYGSDYWKSHMLQLAGTSTMDEYVDMYLSGRALYWLKTILKYKHGPGQACEVACGLGQLSYYLDKAGFNITAMELNNAICVWIKEALSINVLQGEFQKRTKFYDLIVANDLLEHLEEPVRFIENVSDSLNEEGVLVIQTPCYDGVSEYPELVERNASFLSLMIPDEHLYLFTREGLRQLFAKFNMYIHFEDAFFGNDYDMYAFASKSPLKTFSEEETTQYLYSIPDGRLIKTLIDNFDEKRALERKLYDVELRLSSFDKDVRCLNELIKDKEKALNQLDEQCKSVNELARQKDEIVSEIKSYRFVSTFIQNDERRHLYTMLSEYTSDLKSVRSMIKLLNEDQTDYSDDYIKELKKYAKAYIQLASFIAR